MTKNVTNPSVRKCSEAVGKKQVSHFSHLSHFQSFHFWLTSSHIIHHRSLRSLKTSRAWPFTVISEHLKAHLKVSRLSFCSKAPPLPKTMLSAAKPAQRPKDAQRPKGNMACSFLDPSRNRTFQIDRKRQETPLPCQHLALLTLFENPPCPELELR